MHPHGVFKHSRVDQQVCVLTSTQVFVYACSNIGVMMQVTHAFFSFSSVLSEQNYLVVRTSRAHTCVCSSTQMCVFKYSHVHSTYS